MSVQKVQVNVTLWASEKDLPLGHPLVVVFKSSESLTRRLLLCSGGQSTLTARRGYTWPAGQLQHQSAEEMSSVLGNMLYERLLLEDGVTSTLDESSGAET